MAEKQNKDSRNDIAPKIATPQEIQDILRCIWSGRMSENSQIPAVKHSSDQENVIKFRICKNMVFHEKNIFSQHDTRADETEGIYD